MLTLRSAAALLQGAAAADSMAPLLAAVGFDSPPLPLDDEAAAAALGVPDALGAVHVVHGPGALRGLLAEADCGRRPLREHVARLAGRLAARAPHLLWLVAVAERGGSGLALAAWSAERSPPRVVSLVVDRRRVVDSDAETLCALAAAVAPGAELVTYEGWLDVLGRESLTRRFYRALEGTVLDLGAAASAGGRATAEERKEVALLYVSRLLFLAFLEAKGWLDGDRGFLTRTFERCLTSGGAYHRRVLLPLFFGTLNTPVARRAAAARALGRVPFLNGGLFARSPLERRTRGLAFPDDALGRVFGELLGRYRFTAREDRATWSEAAVDPEMLGKAFESLMAARERRASGAFYTPQPLVERVTTAALVSALACEPLGVCEGMVVRALDGDAPPDPRVRDALGERAARLRLLDPACGSGAFLVHALERLAALLATLGDRRPPTELRRAVLARSIFGVDVNPAAVWLCELRLWLSVVIESDERDPLRVTPLPNLDRNVRVGDSLAGGDFGAVATDGHRGGGGGGRRHAVERLRQAYVRATGARKRGLARALDCEERARALSALDGAIAGAEARRRELLSSLRSRDLFGERHPSRAGLAAARELRERTREWRARRRALAGGAALPFAFAAHFADAAADGGFDVVVGNPPWVRLHRVPPSARAALRREFRVFRHAAWVEGAARTGAGRGFAAQVDLASLFLERALALLRPGGTLALLVPVKLWRSLAGGGVRRLLADEAELLALEDLSASRHAFDAAVYPSLVAARRGSAGGVRPARVAVHRRAAAERWALPPDLLPLDRAEPASPWLLLSPQARGAFDRLRSAGVAMADGPLGRPLLGVKCGCNEAFLVRPAEGAAPDAAVARVRDAAGRAGCVEREMLRPLLRGEGVARWRCPPPSEWLIWTHGADRRPLPRLPPHALRWLSPWRARLTRRADTRGAHAGAAWWSLFRVEAAADAGAARVVWADIGRAPRAAVLPPGDPTVPLNSCYVLRCPTLADAYALAALLNAPPAAAWLDALAEPARGGYRRYLGWTLALLPLPADWARARAILAPLGARGWGGECLTSDELTEAALAAYEVAVEEVEALLAWGRE